MQIFKTRSLGRRDCGSVCVRVILPALELDIGDADQLQQGFLRYCSRLLEMDGVRSVKGDPIL